MCFFFAGRSATGLLMADPFRAWDGTNDVCVAFQLKLANGAR
jgi:hypothetical protein